MKIKVVVEVIVSEPDRAGHVYRAARFYDTESGASIQVGDIGESNARAACLMMDLQHGEYLVIECTLPRRQWTRAGLEKWRYMALEDVGESLNTEVQRVNLSR